MNRWAAIILFLLVLALPFALRGIIHPPAAVTRTPGGDRLVIVTPNNQDIRREFAQAFDRWHRAHHGTGVWIDYRTPGGTNDIKRLIQTLYDGQRRPDGSLPPPEQIKGVDIDLLWGGGDFMFNNELKPMGVLAPIHLPDKLLGEAFPRPTLGGIRLYDYAVDAAGQVSPPQWIGACLSSFGIIYNPSIYKMLGLDAPATWSDLANPRLAGWVALADPTHSGSVAVAYMMVLQRAMADAEAKFLRDHPDLHDLPPAKLHQRGDYQSAIDQGWHQGMGTLLLIAANARYFTDSATMPPYDVSNGDAAAGVAIDFYANTYEEIMGDQRIRYIAPAAATAITPDPVAIPYGTHGRQLTLATHFIEFLLSPEGQRLWILKAGSPGGPVNRSLRRSPIRRDIYADRTDWTDTSDPFTLSGGFNQQGRWMTLFTDIRPLWAAAWIDSRQALKDAYAAILAVRDDTRRGRLIAELADVPVTRTDVERIRQKRVELRHSPEYSLWAAREQVQWAQRFRAHYAKVAAAASQ